MLYYDRSKQVQFFFQNRLHSVKNRVGGIEGRGEKEDNRIILRSGCHEMHWLRWQPILLTTYIEEVVDKRNVVSIWPGLSLLDDWVISTAAEMGFSLSPSLILTFFLVLSYQQSENTIGPVSRTTSYILVSLVKSRK